MNDFFRIFRQEIKMLKTMNNPLGRWYFNEEFFDKYANVYFIVMRVA